MMKAPAVALRHAKHHAPATQALGKHLAQIGNTQHFTALSFPAALTRGVPRQRVVEQLQLCGCVWARAAAAGESVTIHVERMNPALALYERLGFVLEEERVSTLDGIANHRFMTKSL